MADVTATVLCTAALRKIRAIDPTETPNATELDNAFTEMKRMLKVWAAKGVLLPYSTLDSHTLTAGTASYTIGSGGTIDTVRPIKINHGSYVTSGGLDVPLTIIGEAQYNQIADKSSGADCPEFIWYKPAYPLGTIYLYPPGGGTLYLWSQKYITDPAAIGNNLVLPEEYQDAVVWNLACRMAPEFIGDPTPYMIAMAETTKSEIAALNEANDPAISQIEISQLGAPYTYDIDAGA